MPDARLVDDLGADHIDVVGIIVDIEEDFGVELSDAQIERVATVGDLIEAIGTAPAAVAQAA